MVLRNSFIVVSFVLLLLIPRSYSSENVILASSPKSENDVLEFLQNLIYLVAEFFLGGTTGRGLDSYAPELAQGGPSPIGARIANVDPLTRNVSYQFGVIAVAHLRAVKLKVKDISRPLMDLSREVFANITDSAFGGPVRPRFDPYQSTVNYQLASFIITLVFSTEYAGSIRHLQKLEYKEEHHLEFIQQFEQVYTKARNSIVPPYNLTVAEFTNGIAEQANRLGREGIKSEGIEVPPSQGADGNVSGNVTEGDKYSLTYLRTQEAVLRIIYGSGNESVAGALFPEGANGRIAQYYLKN